MTEEIKKAVQLAEKELEETKIGFLKDMVKKTLEAIENLTKEKNKLEEEIKVLKMDIDDLKAGRLDKIEERQNTSELAKRTSKISVKEKEIQIPSQIHSYLPYWQRIYSVTPLYYEATTWTSDGNTVTFCSSDCATNVSGTYQLGSGTIKYL